MLAFARPTAPAVYESTQQLAEQQSIAEVPSIRCVLSLQRLPPAVCVLACRKMAVGPEISISEGRLLISGTPLLSAVPDNVVLTPHQGLGPVSGAFLGATALESSSRHLFTLGTFEDLRFMCCFRFKIWWMTQRMGSCGREVPQETQFMLLESKATDEVALDGTAQCRVYTVLLPLLEGSFRASLQGSELNELQLCLESGDPKVQSYEGLHALFMASGTDPFQVVSDAVRAIEAHSRSFSHREKKKMPGILDVFGWCTWNAFYIDVSADKVNQGLNSLSQGGTPARFLIIDDGWQSIQSENRDNATVTDGMQYASRLTSIKANHKFHGDADLKASRSPVSGLQRTVQEAKEKYNVRYIYVWHALTGYWGGVQPNSTEMQEYEPALKYPVHSPGVLANQPDMAVDSLTTNGLGLVKPEKLFTFYNDLHSYLASSGVDGVKVDAQSIIETLGAGAGGRVSLVRQYTEALEASVTRNFPDNGCIACMSHSLDGVYSTKRTPVVRASDDFYPEDPASHTIHIASVAYNSLFLGEFMQPDWDMFQTLHPAAAYHGAARAVGGCPIYVSDKPGHHDFDLLRKLVLPNGSVLRARLPGRPTWDSLFVDPARDDTSLLKIWNMNKCTGVLGVFNCQGAGWCKVGRRNTIHDTSPKTLTGSLHGCDVHLLESAAGKDWNGDCMFYSHQAGKVLLLPRGAAFPVTLKVLEFEVYTVTPLKELASGARFAPIGLLDMFNSGGAVEELSYQVDESLVRMVIQGCGRFGVYTSQRPRAVFTDSAVPDDVLYDEVDGLLSFTVPAMKEAGQLWDVTLHL